MCFSVLAVAALSSCQTLNNTLAFKKHYKYVMSALISHRIVLYPNKRSIYILLFVFLCYLSAQRVNIGHSVFIAVRSRERQSLQSCCTFAYHGFIGALSLTFRQTAIPSAS